MPPKKNVVQWASEEELEEEILRWKLRERALSTLFIKRMEEVDGARAEEEELRLKCQQLSEAYGEAKQERFDIISDFTRQHKAIEDELIARITVLDSTITDLRDQKELSILALKETEKEREQYIAQKQREFEEQEKKMKEMDNEFHIMLSDTQNKMTERVTATMQMVDEEDEEVEAEEPPVES